MEQRIDVDGGKPRARPGYRTPDRLDDLRQLAAVPRHCAACAGEETEPVELPDQLERVRLVDRRIPAGDRALGFDMDAAEAADDDWPEVGARIGAEEHLAV